MNKNILSERMITQSRIQVIEMESGLEVRIINIGDPDLDLKINNSVLERVLNSLELIKLSRNITIIFDNRSYPKIIKEALRNLRTRDDANSAFMAIFRTLGLHAQAIKEQHTIYMNTQDIAFYEIIGFDSIDNITKHELAHLSQQHLDSYSHGIRTLVGMLIEISGCSAMVIKTLNMMANKSPHTIADSAIHFGFIVISFGTMVISKTLLYSNSENEKDANKKTTAMKEFVLVNGRQQTLSERIAKKIGSKISKAVQK